MITAATGNDTISVVKQLGADIVVDYRCCVIPLMNIFTFYFSCREKEIWDILEDDSVDVVYDNIGLKGTASKALAKIRKGGTYLLLPGGGGGTLSNKTKPGHSTIACSRILWRGTYVLACYYRCDTETIERCLWRHDTKS